MAVKTVSTFTLPDEYQRQASEARRRRRMAEMLAQQAYQPGGIQNAPIPRGAPLVQGLQAFLAARAARKADEAEESAEEKASQIGSQIAGRLTGREIVPAAPVDAFGLQEFQSAAPAFAQDMQRRNAEEQAQLKAGDIQEVTRQSQYVYDPQDAMRLAMTRGGNAAMRGNPALAAMLSRMMEKPEAEEFYAPTETADGLVQFGKRGGVRKTGVEAPAKTEVGMTEYQRKMLGLRERDVSLRERATGVNRPMSATAQRELFDADENVLATQSGIEMLDQAIKLSPVAYEGIGASERAKTATILPDRFEPAGTKETLEFDLLLKQQVLPQLKSIFGSAPTEGERAILLELQGSSSLPKATRENLLKRARNMANQRLQFNKQKAQKLREGSYFMEQPTVIPPDGFELE